MPLRITVGLSRKVGEPHYGSRGASLNLELEVDAGLFARPTKLRERLRKVFALVRTSLVEELEAGKVCESLPAEPSCAPTSKPGAAMNGKGEANGQHPAAARSATPLQIKATGM